MLMHPQGIRRFTPSVDQLKNIPKEFHEDGKKGVVRERNEHTS